MYDYSSDRNKELLILYFLLESESFYYFLIFFMWAGEIISTRFNFSYPVQHWVKRLLESIPLSTDKLTADTVSVWEYVVTCLGVKDIRELISAMERYDLNFISIIHQDKLSEYQDWIVNKKIIPIPLIAFNWSTQINGDFAVFSDCWSGVKLQLSQSVQ